MPYLLDGNNLIGRARPSEAERRALVGEVASRLRRTRARAVLVFDGGERRETSLGPLTIREGQGESADEDILRQVARAKNPREMVVVTGDRELGRRVRDAGGKVLPPAEFWSDFGERDAGVAKGEPPVDVDEWTRYFDDETNRK